MHGNFKNVPKFSHSYITQSQWRNPEIIFDTGFLGYLNYTTQLFCILFLTQLTRIHIWNPTNLIWNYWHIICKTKLSKYLPVTHICIYSLCQLMMTLSSLWRHKGIAMHVTHKPCIAFQQCMIRHRPLRRFACRFRLRIVSKLIHSCHNQI